MLKLKVLTIICLLGFSLQAQTAPVEKSKTTQMINGKSFIIHSVKSGETLYAIGKAYGVSVSVLKENNNLENGLQKGQRLKIPYSRKSSNEHTVKAGETLYSISQKHKVSVTALKSANPNLSTSLRVGQVIKIPSSNTAIPKVKPATTKQPASSTKKHQVKRGETLYSIARNYKVSVSQIRAVNPGTVDGLSVGQVIAIPTQANQTQRVLFKNHKVAAGETLYSICKIYKISPNVLLQHNPHIAGGLKTGQVLKIPIEKNTETAPNKQFKKSKNKVTINGTLYYLHNVQEGENLKTISELYEIPISVIIAENPEAKSGVLANQRLKIPANNKSISVSHFHFHTVKKGETLYSISKKYSVGTNDIIENNSVLKAGLKDKTIIKIPTNDDNIHLANNATGTTIYHVIEQGETVSSVSNKYQCSLKDIKKLNPSVDINNVSPGTVLKVNVTNEQFKQYIVQATEEGMFEDATSATDSIVGQIICDSIIENKDDIIKIALFAPFYSTANDTMDLSDKIANNKERIYKKSIMYVHFYQGVLLSLENLKKQGYKIQLNVYDTEYGSAKDTLKIKRMVSKINKENTDMIIGPFHNNTFKIASQKAKEEGIFILSPLSQQTSLIKDNPKAILANTPQKYRTESSALYVSQYEEYNYIIIHNNGIKELDNIQNFKDVLFNSQEDSTYFNSVVFKEINFKENGIQAIEDAVSITTKNIIYIPSDNPAFINDILTKLYRFVNKYEIEVHGMAQWERFKNIELDYLFNLNYHFTTSNFRDYKKDEVKEFIKNYRKTFSTEPSKFVFQGYDLLQYTVKTTALFRENICDCIDSYSYEGLHTNIKVGQYSEENGYTNTSIYLVHYTPDYLRSIIDFDVDLARELLKENQKEEQSSPEPQLFMIDDDVDWDY